MTTASATRQRRRTLQREMSRLSREQDTQLKVIQRAAEGQTGRRMVHASLHDAHVAMYHPVLGRHVWCAVLMAFGSAKGLKPDGMSECFFCRQGWGRKPGERRPAAVAQLVTTKPDALLISLVCDECLVDTATVERRLGEAVQRDFFGDDVRVLPVAALSPEGGHA